MADNDLPRFLWQNAVMAATYWALAILVKEYFSRYQMWPAPLWVPAGIAMFAAFSMGPGSWVGIFPGSFLTDTITFGEPAAWADRAPYEAKRCACGAGMRGKRWGLAAASVSWGTSACHELYLRGNLGVGARL
jgi:hypothetical protein